MYEEKATKITRKNRAKLKKPSQTRIGRFESVFVLKKPNQNWSFEPVSVFFKKTNLIIFFDKN
jgi:hypothetical protein